MSANTRDGHRRSNRGGSQRSADTHACVGFINNVAQLNEFAARCARHMAERGVTAQHSIEIVMYTPQFYRLEGDPYALQFVAYDEHGTRTPHGRAIVNTKCSIPISHFLCLETKLREHMRNAGA